MDQNQFDDHQQGYQVGFPNLYNPNPLIDQVFDGQGGPPPPPQMPMPPQPAFAQQLNIRVDANQPVQALEQLANLVGQSSASNIEINQNIQTFGRNVDGALHGLSAAIAQNAARADAQAAELREAVREHAASASRVQQTAANAQQQANATANNLLQQALQHQASLTERQHEVQQVIDKLANLNLGLAQKQDDLVSALAIAQRQAPVGPGAQAHPGPAAHQSSELAGALNNLVNFLGENQGTQSHKVACTHANLLGLERALAVLAVSCRHLSGQTIDDVRQASDILDLVFNVAFPGKQEAAAPAGDLGNQDRQWQVSQLRTLQLALTRLKLFPLESAAEREETRFAFAPFFRRAKHCDSWFAPRPNASSANATGGAPGGKRRQKRGELQQQQQQLQFMPQQPQQPQWWPQPLAHQQPLLPPAAPKPIPKRPKGKNAGVGTD